MPTQRNINIGAANQGNGDTLFDAFTKIQANFDELFDDEAAGEVSSVTAGNGLTGTATTGAITINAVGGDGITANADELEVAVDDSTIELSATNGSGTVRIKDGGVTNAKLADDAVDHDELAARYTSRASSVTTSGATTIDWSSHAIHEIVLGGAHTLNFSNYKKAQVLDLLVSGNYAPTLGTSSGTPAFKKVGDVDYDGSSSKTNLIQVICTDDDSTPEFLYSVAVYATDDTP